MTENQYDAVLKSGLILFKERQLQSVPQESEIDYNFSRDFEKKMEKLIRNQESSLWLFMQKTGRKIAVFIVAIIITFTASLSIKAVREAVFDFFYKVFTDHALFYGEITSVVTDMHEYYVIPHLPEGFSVFYDNNYTEITPHYVNITYINNYESKIEFYQNNSSPSGTFDSENGEVKEIIINEVPVLLCHTGNIFICTWNEKDRFFQLLYPSYLGEEYIHKVAGKLEETKPVPLS